MIPVNQYNGRTIGDFVAGGRTAYGTVVVRTAAETAKAAAGSATAILGVACDRQQPGQTPGFYEQYELMEIQVDGIAMFWLLGGVTIQSGNYFKVATLGAGTENLGLITPESTATTKTVASIGRVVGGATYGDAGNAGYDQVLTADAAISDTVLTLDAAKMTALGLSPGDYIAIGDTDSAEINIVKSVTSTAITVQNPLTAAFTTAASATVYRLTQVKGVFI